MGNGRSFEIEDPLKVSIKKFLGAVNGLNAPLVEKKKFLKVLNLQRKLLLNTLLMT